MNKAAFKKRLDELLEQKIDGMTEFEKMSLVKKVTLEFERDLKWEETNKGSSWTDDELKVVLGRSPTRENITILARGFRRSFGSIELIFRWAATDDKTIKTKRPDDKFVHQVKRVAKEIGWRV